MSRIDALISEHCPEGVEAKPLGQVGQFIRGNGLQKKDFVEDGVGCIHYGQIYTHYGTSATVTKSFVTPELAEKLRSAQPGDLVVTTTSENIEDVGKAVAWLGEGPIAIGGHSCSFAHSLDPLYAAFYFQTDAFHRQKRRFVKGTKVKELSTHDFARIEIPVPPIAIQREIVSILTKMEELEAELEAELKAELEARRRQYAHYVDICFNSEVVDADVRPLGEIGSFRRGKRITKSELMDHGLGAIHYGEMYTHYGTCAYATKSFVAAEKRPALSLANPGDLVIAGTGENVVDLGRAVAWLGKDPVAVHDDCFILSHSLEPAFVSYFFQSASFHQQKRRYVAGAKVSRISSRDLARIEIPVPPADEQRRVVHVLTTLEQLTSDLAIGIPAEIAARRQQYEYYRDRLFDFERLAA